MSETSLFRVGGASAVIGGLVALVANVLHPRVEDFTDYAASRLTIAAESGAWIAIHLALIAGTLLIAFGLFAVVRSLKDGPAEGAARIALGGILVSLPVALVALAVDGYASKAVADATGAAAGGAGSAGAWKAVAEIEWGLFMLLIMTLLGIAPVLVGWAVALSGRYPATLGWPIVVVGAAGLLVGVWGTVSGPSAGFFVAFLVTSGLATLWVLAIGATLWRRAAAIEGVEARPRVAPS